MFESISAFVFVLAELLPILVVCGCGATIAFRRRGRHPWVSRIVMIACVCEITLAIGIRFVFPALSKLFMRWGWDPSQIGEAFSIVLLISSWLFAAVFGLLVWAALAGRGET